MDYTGRAEGVRKALAEQEADALLVTDLTNVRYLTGFDGTNGQVLVTSEDVVFFSDPRYAARAADLVTDAEVVIYPARLTEELQPRLVAGGIERLGLEGGTVTLAQRDELAKRLGEVELVATKEIVERLRRAKAPEEVDLVRRAVAAGDAAFGWILERLAPGRRESDVALELEMHIRAMGVEGISSPPIVGSGPLSAHIHHTPGGRVLTSGDFVLLDFGARVGGYCSDLTRTVVLGAASDEQREQYATVLAAYSAGVAAVRTGVGGREADAAARAVVDAAGHGELFAHGIGHGVGLDIHEAPRLAKTSEDSLVTGDVVTVEPGIYLNGAGGVRIEDCVLVGEKRGEVLGRAPKDELIEIA
ncbi:Xaa-Pro peptidase family protein [soil metagenome]